MRAIQRWIIGALLAAVLALLAGANSQCMLTGTGGGNGMISAAGTTAGMTTTTTTTTGIVY